VLQRVGEVDIITDFQSFTVSIIYPKPKLTIFQLCFYFCGKGARWVSTIVPYHVALELFVASPVITADKALSLSLISDISPSSIPILHRTRDFLHPFIYHHKSTKTKLDVNISGSMKATLRHVYQLNLKETSDNPLDQQIFKDYWGGPVNRKAVDEALNKKIKRVR